MLSDGMTLAAGAGLSIAMLDDTRRGNVFPSGASNGDLWELTEQLEAFGPGSYEYQNRWVLRNPAVSALTYDISGTVLGRPDNAAKILYIVAARTFYIQGAMAGAIARALVAPDTEQDFSVSILRGNEFVGVGSIHFEPGIENGEFRPLSQLDIRVQRGDVLNVIAPDVVDQSIADISFTICGYLAV